jgi:hypothetical protein
VDSVPPFIRLEPLPIPAGAFKPTGLPDELFAGMGKLRSDMRELPTEELDGLPPVMGKEETLFAVVMLPIRGVPPVPPMVESRLRLGLDDGPIGVAAPPLLVRAVLLANLSEPPRLVMPNPLSAAPFINEEFASRLEQQLHPVISMPTVHAPIRPTKGILPMFLSSPV